MNVGGAIGVMTLPEAKREEIYIQGPLKMELLLRADYKKDHPVKIFYQFAAMKELNEKILEVASAKEKVEGPFMWDYLVPDGHCDARCDSGTLQTPAVSSLFKTTSEKIKTRVRKSFRNLRHSN